jgi:4-amino-4-deoxy-L-arabinose transferase-like glycosyltransferase
MKSQRLLVFASFALAAVLLFARLGGLPLTDPDEGRNTAVAHEMLVRGDWFVPTYNGVTYLDKPALFFRMVATSMAALGENETAARLPSALCALALLGVIFTFCRRQYGTPTAALAVAVTGSAPLFFAFGRTVIFDMPLALAVTIAILAAYIAEHGAGKSDSAHQPAGGRDARPPVGLLPWWSGGRWHAAAAAATATAVLLKGPVGLIVPGLVTVAAHFAQSREARRPGFFRRLCAPLNFAIFFALTLPWFLGVVHRQPDFLQYGLVEETVRRYATTSFHRTAPWWYYAPVVLGTFFPWSALLPEGAAAAWRRRRHLPPADRLFLVCAIVVVVFFSTSQSKLPGYILVAVVALGVLVARLFATAMSEGGSQAPGREPDRPVAMERPAARRLILRATLVLAGLALLAAAFLGFMVADPEAARRVFHIRGAEFERLRPAFVPMAVTFGFVALAAGAARIARRTEVAFGVFLLFPLSVVTVSFGALQTSIEAGSSRGLAARVPPGAEVACLECFPNGLPFYLGREVAIVTHDGRELTSNYALYKLRSPGAWPATLVPAADRDVWLAKRHGPVFLLAKNRNRGVLDSLAAAHGGAVSELRRGWWGALLPAAPIGSPNSIGSPK